MSKEYTIKQITDIFQIPEDKLDEFIVDLRAYYHCGKHLTNLIDTVAKAKGLDTKTLPQHMTWIDDGNHDASIRISTNDRS